MQNRPKCKKKCVCIFSPPGVHFLICSWWCLRQVLLFPFERRIRECSIFPGQILFWATVEFLSRAFLMLSGRLMVGIPVLELRNQPAWALPWRTLRPRLPDRLYAPSRELRGRLYYPQKKKSWLGGKKHVFFVLFVFSLAPSR